MKKLITLFALGMLISTQLIAGPGKKKHRSESQEQAHELAIPSLGFEDEAILIRQSPIEEEKAIAMEAEEKTATNVADIQEKPALTERQTKRLGKAEHRLNKRIAKLKKKPNATLWDSRGTNILYIALIIAIVAIALSLLSALLGGGVLGAIAWSAWTIAVILAIVGLVIGFMG